MLKAQMRSYYIKILLGDKARVELHPYDLKQGHVVYRYKRKRVRKRSRYPIVINCTGWHHTSMVSCSSPGR